MAPSRRRAAFSTRTRPDQVVVGDSTFGIWEEEIYQLWVDVETLYELRNALDQNLMRVSEIDRALRDFTLLVDLEAPCEEMIKGVRACRKRLKPLLECVNGSTSPLIYACGHSHIDVAWLWPFVETWRKVARTMSTQLALMEEYPDYKFLQSSVSLLHGKEALPRTLCAYEEGGQTGQLIPEGGMWVEPDMNIAGGEAIIRQCTHAKRFFREEFGIENELLWLPDVFGYSAALPQILRGCAIKYFSTSKIFWNYHGGENSPSTAFRGKVLTAQAFWPIYSTVTAARVIRRRRSSAGTNDPWRWAFHR